VTAMKALEELCEAYAEDFGADGYDQRDMIDFVVGNTLQPDLDALAQKNGIGIDSLIAWYEGRAAYLRRLMPSMVEHGVEPGAPSEEQRARRGKVR
jgi:hypothetical protein